MIESKLLPLQLAFLYLLAVSQQVGMLFHRGEDHDIVGHTHIGARSMSISLLAWV
jgi:hypothetical protein